MGKLPGQSHDEIARAVFLCNKSVPSKAEARSYYIKRH